MHTDDSTFDLKQFSLKGKSKTMEQQMLDDRFVMSGLAILGQASVIYAKPNTGKTLLTLYKIIEAIEKGDINGDDVFYINADDSFKGLVAKTKLAEKHGFHMICPGHNGFESKAFLSHLQQLMKQKTASGKVIVLDTLKKFADLMDKRGASEFMQVGREFVSNGGTLIMLAHTNKNRDNEGNVIFAGTSDIVDDVDCAFTLDEVESTATSKTVLFKNIKSRGDVDREAAYQYAIVKSGESYSQLLESVRRLDQANVEKAIKTKEISDLLDKNDDAINAIIEAIEAGCSLKTDIIKAAHEAIGISRPKLARILKQHTGTQYHLGYRWREIKGEKNAKHYELVKPSVTSALAYQYAKMKN